MADEKEIQESLRWEYREVAANHRFYVGLRFIIAAFTATLHSTLLTFYNNANEVLRKAQEAGQVLGINLGEWHTPADVQVPMIAAVGVTTIVAIFWMEGRNINRLTATMIRAAELEFKLGLGDGQYVRLRAKSGKISFATYTWSLKIMYSILGFMWFVLFLLNFFSLVQRS